MFKRILSIRPFPLGGWHLSALVLPGSDEMWVRRDHPAVFRSLDRAEAFLAKVERKPLNLANWIGEDWVGSPLRIDESANPAPYSVL